MNSEYKAFIALVAIAGVVITALLLPPVQSEDIFIVNGGGGSNATQTNIFVTSPITKNATSGNVLIACPTCITTSSGMVLLVDSVLNSSGTVNITTGTSAGITCANVAINGCGEHADTSSSALIGKVVNSVSMFIYRGANVPTGTNTVCVMQNYTCVYTFGTFAGADITTTPTEYLFSNFNANYKIVENDFIGIKTNLQSGADAILVRGVTGASNYDTTNSLCAQHINGNWATAPNCDLGATATPFILSAVNSFSISGYDNYYVSLQAPNTGTPTLTFMLNGETNAVYSTRYSLNGASDGTSTNQRACQPTFTTGQATLDNLMLTMVIGDYSSTVRRGVMGETMHGFDSALSTAPSRSEFVCKYNNQSVPVTSLQVSATGLPPFGTGIVNTGSPQYNGHIEIWGYN